MAVVNRFEPERRLTFIFKKHAWIQRGGGGGGQGVRTPPEIYKNIGFLSNAGSDPLEKSQICQASIQCWAITGTSNDVSLAGR